MKSKLIVIRYKNLYVSSGGALARCMATQQWLDAWPHNSG